MAVYEVRDAAGFVVLVEARDSTEAKKIVCRRRGVRPGDYWAGAGTMTARRIKEKEERVG